MTKDVLGVQGETELDAISGYLLELAKDNNVSVPLSERLYDVCAARFAEPSFKPMTAQALKQAVFA